MEQTLDNPNVTFINFYNLGYLYMQQGEYAQAKELFRRVLGEVPDYAYALNNLARCYRFTGDLDSSIILYNELVKTDPTFTTAYYDIGLNWLDLNQVDSSKTYLEKYMRFAYPSSPDYQTARFLLDSLSN